MKKKQDMDLGFLQEEIFIETIILGIMEFTKELQQNIEYIRKNHFYNSSDK